MSHVPIIDMSALDDTALGHEVDLACRNTGFFVVTGHGIDPTLFEALDSATRKFFALPHTTKAEIAMSVGGRAWRGWFPLGGEVTSGIPDRKEGLYLGEELGADDPRVAAGVALHGPNLFPSQVPELGPAVLAWMDALTGLGHRLMSAIAVGLDLPANWFRRNLTAEPMVLFRIFRYPDTSTAPVGAADERDMVDRADEWGVAEHTDYGLLTMLAQDDCGGLQVKASRGPTRPGWVDVVPVPNSFVCNIGDMLERMTGGRYRSTPHRVRNTSGRDRFSYPFFFDPSWDARIDVVPLADRSLADRVHDDRLPDDVSDRWDAASVFDFDGTYGEYLTAKVSKVFPELGREIGRM